MCDVSAHVGEQESMQVARLSPAAPGAVQAHAGNCENLVNWASLEETYTRVAPQITFVLADSGGIVCCRFVYGCQSVICSGLGRRFSVFFNLADVP